MMEDAAVQTPRQAAGFLSLLTFSWMNNVLKLDSKQPLEEKHLFPVEPVNQSEKLVGELEKEWLAEERASEQNRTKPRLWRAMMRVISYRDYIILGLLRVFYSVTLNLLPVILWFFLRSISSVSFVVAITVVTCARSVCINQSLFKMEVIAIRLKVAVIGLVYKKASICSYISKTCTKIIITTTAAVAAATTTTATAAAATAKRTTTTP